VVLGNHDYGEYPINTLKAEHQITYHESSDKFYLPERYYSISPSPLAKFWALDTNSIMLKDLPATDPSTQKSWLLNEINNSTQSWRFAFGHHPYISNGKHGNAGAYEGLDILPFEIEATTIARGEYVKEFMDEAICGQVDIYFAGHDHNRQWLEPQCGTEFIVSGAGAKTTDLVGRGTPTFYEEDENPGFLYVQLTETTFVGEFYDMGYDPVSNPTPNYSRTLNK
jgi:hypothetical protein